MAEFLLLAFGAALVNNVALGSFAGAWPFLGASHRSDIAGPVGLATAIVLTASTLLGHLVWRFLLLPLGLGYLRTLCFVLLVAAIAQLASLVARARWPVMHERLGRLLPLIAANCAVLGVMLTNADERRGVLESATYGAASGAGFALALLLLATLRERLDTSDVPGAFRGVPIALVTAGLMALAFMGLAGLAAR